MAVREIIPGVKVRMTVVCTRCHAGWPIDLPLPSGVVPVGGEAQFVTPRNCKRCNHPLEIRGPFPQVQSIR